MVRIFSLIYHTFQPNVGKYAIHGAYGMYSSGDVIGNEDVF